MFSGLCLHVATIHPESLIIMAPYAGQLNPDEPTDEELEDITKEVMGKLGENYTILYSFLRIPAYVVAEIEGEPSLRRKVHKALQTWRSLNSGHATRAELAGLLKKTDRSLNAIATKLEKNAPSYTETEF